MSWAGAAVGLGTSLIGGLSSKSAAKTQAAAANQAAQLSKEQFDQTRKDLMPWQKAGNVSLNELMYRLGLSPNQGAQGQAKAPVKPVREQFVQNVPGKQTGGAITGNGSWQPTMGPATTKFDETGFSNAMGKYQTDLGAYEQAGQAAQGDPNYGSLLDTFGMDDFQESPAYQFNLQEGMEAINKSAAAKGKYYAPATLQDIGKYSQGLASNEFQNAFSNYNTGQNNIFSRLMGVSNQGQNSAAQTGAFGANAANVQGEAAMGAGNARAAGTMGASNAITGGVADAYNNYLLSQVLGQRQNPTYGV